MDLVRACWLWLGRRQHVARHHFPDSARRRPRIQPNEAPPPDPGAEYRLVGRCRFLGLRMRYIWQEVGLQCNHWCHRCLRPDCCWSTQLCCYRLFRRPLVLWSRREFAGRFRRLPGVPTREPSVPPDRPVHLLGLCTAARHTRSMATSGLPYLLLRANHALHEVPELRMEMVHDRHGWLLHDLLHPPLRRLHPLRIPQVPHGQRQGRRSRRSRP